MTQLDDARRELGARGYYHARLGDVSDAALTEFAEGLGRIAVEVRDPRPVRSVSPSGAAKARQNTLSSRYGLGAFPFHTDTAYWREPASFLLLYCVDPGQGLRKTLVSDTRSWRLSAGEATALARSLWRVRRQREAFLVRLASPASEGLHLRYDVHCMSAVGAESAEAALLVEERAASHVVAITWSAGDVLIIDNRRAVHARTAATDPDNERTLKRILVHAHG